MSNELRTQLCSLPRELVVYIFNVTAVSSKEFALTLCLVSSWTRHIALPHLLHSVILTSDNQFQTFHDLVTSGAFKPLHDDFHPALLVRRLWMPDVRTPSYLPNMLSRCPNLVDICASSHSLLAVILLEPEHQYSIYPQSGRDVRVTVKREPYRRMNRSDLFAAAQFAITADTWSKSNPNLQSPSPICDMVTHLHFDSPFDRLTRAYIRQCPRLSHLAVKGSNNREVLDALEAFLCTTELKLLVIVVLLLEESGPTWDGDEWIDSYDLSQRNKSQLEWVRNCRKTNPVVHFAGAVLEEAQIEWKEEVEGRETIWEKAVRQTREWEASEDFGNETFQTVTMSQVSISE